MDQEKNCLYPAGQAGVYGINSGIEWRLFSQSIGIEFVRYEIGFGIASGQMNDVYLFLPYANYRRRRLFGVLGEEKAIQKETCMEPRCGLADGRYYSYCCFCQLFFRLV